MGELQNMSEHAIGGSGTEYARCLVPDYHAELRIFVRNYISDDLTAFGSSKLAVLYTH